MSKYKRYNYNKILYDELNELRYFYYNNFKNIKNNIKILEFDFNDLINKVNLYNYYYFLNNNYDLYVFKFIETININLMLL